MVMGRVQQCTEACEAGSTAGAQHEARIAAFTVCFLSHFHAVVEDANYTFLHKTLISARAAHATERGQLSLLEAACDMQRVQ